MQRVNDPNHLEHELTEYALWEAHPLVRTWLEDRGPAEPSGLAVTTM
jgi:hypothetical protein